MEIELGDLFWNGKAIVPPPLMKSRLVQCDAFRVHM